MDSYWKSLNYPITLVHILNHLSHLCLRQDVLNLLRKSCSQFSYQVQSGDLQFSIHGDKQHQRVDELKEKKVACKGESRKGVGKGRQTC
jgi:hypothetical protein